MSTMDAYGSADYIDPPSRRSRRDRRRDDDYESIYAERDGPRGSRQLELVRRPRENSDDYIEEVQRDFPPGEQYYERIRRRGTARRARSLERSYDGYGGYDRYDDHDAYGYGDGAGAYYRGDPRRSVDDDYYDRRSRRDVAEEKPRRRRSLSRFQELAAAGGGAALAIGAKELYSRRGDNKSRSRSRNPLATAAIGVAGTVAGDLAAKQWVKRRDAREEPYRGRDDDEYYAQSDYDRRPRRKKSIGDRAMSALGLRDEDSESDDERGSRVTRRSERGGRDRSRSRAKVEQAVKAALAAGAVEAFRVRKEPGGWGGEKGRRILTAAAGAGGLDALVDRDPEHHSKSHIMEAVIGGLAGNRAINGPRRELSRSRSRSRSRSGRSRSRGGSGLGELAAAGVAAAVGKSVYDRSRRRRSPDSDSDSVSPEPRRRRSRSRSVGDFVNKGLASLGLKDSDRDRDDRRSDRAVARRDGPGYPQARGMPPAQRGRAAGGNEKKGGSRSSSSSSISSSEEERRHKHMRTKELLTAGLATVATIHAAHSLYEGMEAAKERRKALAEGEITPEEARRRRTKATFQDLASVGLAALGIKGAVSQWMEMRKKHKECLDFDKKSAERHRKRMERAKQGGKQGPRPQRYAGGYGAVDYGRGPMYQDANPYSVSSIPPPPPMGPAITNPRYY